MDKQLADALEKAKAWMATASDSEKEAMWQAQRESWARGNSGWDEGTTRIKPDHAEPVVTARFETYGRPVDILRGGHVMVKVRYRDEAWQLLETLIKAFPGLPDR
jgi:hypothetical protein